MAAAVTAVATSIAVSAAVATALKRRTGLEETTWVARITATEQGELSSSVVVATAVVAAEVASVAVEVVASTVVVAVAVVSTVVAVVAAVAAVAAVAVTVAVEGAVADSDLSIYTTFDQTAAGVTKQQERHTQRADFEKVQQRSYPQKLSDIVGISIG